MGKWYVSDGFDLTDKPYIYDGPAKDRNDLISVDLRVSYPGTLDRYAAMTEIAVLDAVCAAIRYLAFFSDNPHLVSQPSRRFIYYNARALPLMDDYHSETKWPDRVWNTGLKIRQALRAVTVYGAAQESRFPWVVQDFYHAHDAIWGINERPSDVAYSEAGLAPILEPFRLDSCQPAVINAMDEFELRAMGVQTLSRVRLCIAEGYPVIFAFHLFWESFKCIKPAQSGDQGYPTIEKIPPERRLAGPRTDSDCESQAALIVAFDHLKRRVLVQSMMESVPYFWMSYEWIIDVRATEGFWMLKNTRNRQGRRVMEKVADETWYSWDKIGSWHLDRIPESSGVSQAPNSSISVISRNNSSVDMFWISEQHTVERAYCYPPGGWIRETIPIKEGEVPLPGAIASVSSQDDKIDIFWMTRDGAICNASWKGVDSKWITRTVIGNGTAEPRAGVSVTIGPRGFDAGDKINVYCVGQDGSIKQISTTASWNGKDTVTSISQPGTAYCFTSIASRSNHVPERYGDGSIWLDVVFWIAPDGSTVGKRQGNRMPWVDIWESKGKEKMAHLNSRIAVEFRNGDDDQLSVYYITPEGKINVDSAGLYVDDDETMEERETAEAYGEKGSKVRVDSAINVVGGTCNGQYMGLVLWQNEYSQLVMGDIYTGSRSIELSVNRGVRRGSPLGMAFCNGVPIIAMKLDDGLIGVGYWGMLNS